MDISSNPNEIAIIVAFTFLIAGVVKGIIGIGLPTTAITIMTFFVSPILALGLNLVPMTVANIWQFSKSDEPKQIISKYKYFAISLVICILISSFYAEKIGDDFVRLIFAIAVLSFVCLQVFGFNFKMPAQRSMKSPFWKHEISSSSGILLMRSSLK